MQPYCIFKHYRGTSGIDIDLRRVDINQCPSQGETDGTINIFGGTDKCKKDTTDVSKTNHKYNIRIFFQKCSDLNLRI